MPKDIKAGIISKNLQRLSQIEHILFFFGVIMIIISYIRFHTDLEAFISEVLYYGSYSISSILVLLGIKQSAKHREWPIWRQNLPTHFAISSMLVLCVSLLYTSTDTFTLYTLFINVCIIAIVLIAVEPAFFITLLVLISIVIDIRLYNKGNYLMILNITLTALIMCILNIYKWDALIREFTLKKITNLHIESMEKEIDLAAFVQESFSKRKIPTLKNYEISYYSKAMAGVSGDMYDFYTQGTILKGAGIFDVSGHGIASGLVTMLVRNIFQQEFHQNYQKPLYEVMEIIDKRIKKEKRNIENYLTGILIRTEGNKVEIVNAGHPAPIIYKSQENKCYFYDEERKFSSSVVGLSSIESFFQESEFEMKKGDEIILFTDGVKEALNSEHAEYGTNRIMDSVKRAVSANFNEQIPIILSDMGMFTKNESQSDDITIVIIKKK